MYATVAVTMCVKEPDYLHVKYMLVRAKLQFKGFKNATQPQKPHWESMRPVFAFSYDIATITAIRNTENKLLFTVF